MMTLWPYIVGIVAGLALAVVGFLRTSAILNAVTALCFLPAILIAFWPARLSIAAKIERHKTFSIKRRRCVAAGVFVLSFGFFVGNNALFDGAFHPLFHDEHAIAVQMQLLSVGKLWSAPHPLAEFFETFHIINGPAVYASIYFPGTAILNVPAVWLHLPLWVIPTCLASAGCMLTYLIAAELLNDIYALAAAAMWFASIEVRMLSQMLLSHNAILCLTPLVIWIFLKWRSELKARWALSAGVVAGLMAITRPLDAIAVLLPVAIAVLITLRVATWRLRVVNLTLAILPLLPFLGIQLVFDKGVTGHWFYPPYQYYNDVAYPHTSFAGGHTDLDDPPPQVSSLPQKQDYYEAFMLPPTRVYVATPATTLLIDRLFSGLTASLPTAALFFFIPIGLLRLRHLEGMVIGLPPILMLCLYQFEVFFPSYYPAMYMPLIAITAMFGVDELVRRFRPASQPLSLLMLVTILTMTVVVYPPLTDSLRSAFTKDLYSTVNLVHEHLLDEVKKPALIFFRYQADCNINDEPVYNILTPRIDDSPVVLAQWLGDKDIDLIRYYHRLGQNRHVYQFDRGRFHMDDLGTVDELAAAAKPTSLPTIPLISPAKSSRPR